MSFNNNNNNNNNNFNNNRANISKNVNMNKKPVQKIQQSPFPIQQQQQQQFMQYPVQQQQQQMQVPLQQQQQQQINNQPNFQVLNNNNILASPYSYNPFGAPNTHNKISYNDDEPIDTIIKKESAKSVTEGKDIDIAKLVNLQLKMRQKQMRASSFIEQKFPVLASISTEKITSSEKAPTDLVCVLDISGSMSGSKIELVKKTFNQVIQYLDANDRMSIVIFDHNAERVTPLMRMTDENKDKTLTLISMIHSRGGTSIAAGLNMAFDILEGRKQKNSVSSIFLLSDGQDGSAIHDGWTKRNLDKKLTIHSFGYGQDHDPQLMAKIADIGDGNFYFIDKYETVDEAFVDCLGSLISTVAKDLELKIQPVENQAAGLVTISKTYGDADMWKKTTDGVTTSSAYLISGKTKDYVLEVAIPKISKTLQDHEKHPELLKLTATMKDINGKTIVLEKTLQVVVYNEDEDIIDEEDDKDVMKHFYRVKGAEALDSARQLADKNANEEAQKLLKAIKEEIENSVVKDEKFIKNLISDIAQAINDVSPQHYHSHGKHNLIGNARAQMAQRSYMQSANQCFNSNNIQQQMVFNAQMGKKKF